MSGDSVATWRHIATQLNELAKAAAVGLLSALRTNPLLLLIVALTGGLSFEALFRLVYEHQQWFGLAAAVFPLQLDLAGIPAYRLAADPTRRKLHRAFGVLVVLVTLGGSVYGNLAYHLNWIGKDTIVFTSVVSPAMCGATLVIWHLPRAARAVVGAARKAHRWRNTVHPPETSSNETQVTPGGQQGPVIKPEPSTPAAGPTLHAVEPVWPEGDWPNGSPIRFVELFWAANDREPTTREVNTAMGPAYAAKREASKHIAKVRARREEAS